MTRTHHVVAWVMAVGVLVGAACSASDDTPAAPVDRHPPTTEAPSPAPPSGAGSSLADATTPLAPAAPLPSVVELPAPTTLGIDALGVEGAPVVPVGVESDGDMEIPPVDEVGWYRFGARPGDEGSAVLAAHVAYDGVDGVFRRLDDLAPGDTVSVRFADGGVRTFGVTEVTRYDKAEVPADVWARGGDSDLVLITCGGHFDEDARSYEDNVVAYAAPV
jgi:LPXTG-site transpeptidase (sortase) family protein